MVPPAGIRRLRRLRVFIEPPRSANHWAIDLTLQVTNVEKGQFTGDKIVARCFRIKSRKSGWEYMTPSGNHPIPAVGTLVRAYLYECERRWATTLINNALARMEQEFAAGDKAALFEQLCGFIVEGVKHRSYADIARQFGLSEDALRQSVCRLRHRYRKLIRDEIAQTVTAPSEVEEELRALFAALSE